MTSPVDDDLDEDVEPVRPLSDAELAAGSEKRAQGVPGMFKVVKPPHTRVVLPPQVWPAPPRDMEMPR